MSHRSDLPKGIGSLIIAFGLSAALFADHTAASQSSTDGNEARIPHDLCGSHRPSLQMVLIATSGVTSESLEIATKQAAAIWARAGLRLVWTTPDRAEGSPARPLLIVLVRPTLTRAATGGTGVSRHGSMPLGWTLVDDRGKPKSTIEVSVASVTALVMSGSYGGRSVTAAPQYVQDELVGRAMGRVIAHEIGHWLFGPHHRSTGLMSMVLDGQALIHLEPPALPREWATTLVEQLTTRSPQCRGASAGTARDDR